VRSAAWLAEARKSDARKILPPPARHKSVPDATHLWRRFFASGAFAGWRFRPRRGAESAPNLFKGRNGIGRAASPFAAAVPTAANRQMYPLHHHGLAKRTRRPQFRAVAHFLVIDDDATTRSVIVFTLESAGHVATAAAGGQEGAALFRAHRPDILITDILMPGDSIAIVIELQREFPEVPCILISGLSIQSPQSSGVAAILQPRHSLPKPFKLVELMQVVDQTLHEQGLPIPPRRTLPTAFSRAS